MIVDDFLVLPHDQIDYASLDVRILRELATQDSEPYIATSALAELATRGGPEARAVARAILNAKPWDRHLVAFAMTTLWDLDRDEAIETMARLLDDTDDAKLLGAMVACVLSDPEYFNASAAREFRDRLVAKVAVSKPDAFTDLAERASFLARYQTPDP